MLTSRALAGSGFTSSDLARVFSRQRSGATAPDRYEGHAGRSVGLVVRAWFVVTSGTHRELA